MQKGILTVEDPFRLARKGGGGGGWIHLFSCKKLTPFNNARELESGRHLGGVKREYGKGSNKKKGSKKDQIFGNLKMIGRFNHAKSFSYIYETKRKESRKKSRKRKRALS